ELGDGAGKPGQCRNDRVRTDGESRAPLRSDLDDAHPRRLSPLDVEDSVVAHVDGRLRLSTHRSQGQGEDRRIGLSNEDLVGKGRMSKAVQQSELPEELAERA